MVESTSNNKVLKSIYLGMLVGLFGFGSLLLMNWPGPSPASASQPVVFGPACGTAVIDGVVDAVEWSGASSQEFQMVVNTVPTPFTGTFKVMNGAAYLYLSFTVNDDELSQSGLYLPKGDSVQLVFDNDHSGTLFSPGDDVLTGFAAAPQFSDGYIVGTPVPSSNHKDTIGGGRTNGIGSVQRQNNLNGFEIKHPICSGDSLDFCLHPGDTVGFRIEYMDAEGNGSFGSTQFYPGPGSTSESDLVIGDCSNPDIYLYLPSIEKSP